ncbi:MAG: hypothetical protein VKK32_05970 [Candidatus Melainabacteria bacterium]|nr:hypothetical protein [Candidatus Melainabacteria bacterium]
MTLIKTNGITSLTPSNFKIISTRTPVIKFENASEQGQNRDTITRSVELPPESSWTGGLNNTESSWLIASGNNPSETGIKTIEISPELKGYEKDIQGIINASAGMIENGSDELDKTLKNSNVIFDVSANIPARLRELANTDGFKNQKSKLLELANKTEKGDINAITLSGEYKDPVTGETKLIHRMLLDANKMSPLASALAIIDHEFGHIDRLENQNNSPDRTTEERETFQKSIKRLEGYEILLREKGFNKTADDLKNTIIPREKKYLELYSN